MRFYPGFDRSVQQFVTVGAVSDFLETETNKQSVGLAGPMRIARFSRLQADCGVRSQPLILRRER